ncbi:alginate export family protein [Methylomonas sp. LL1]|uniref:alginate export family protein n=1 Tax=Methylomonas sp. LL1 TaxID=2785785 RepID=UPI0018C3C7B5|nr:alginate export family protein [Methylomonas sp. LL1]QPK63503.1 alginate export family protein [Methylomonas sp. LL1]QPK64813.1 alginate export family protein [Methylomonas sp. LL1]
MKQQFFKTASKTRLAGVLLLLPQLVNAEDYYRPTKGYRVEPAGDVPAYVRSLSKTQFEQFRDVEWLDLGLDFRSRYEYRENDLRPWTDTSSGTAVSKYRAEPDNLWLLRTRAYVGIKDILDPLRFAVEMEDARSYNGNYETSDADVNEFELIQAYGELYFDNALGHNRPISIRAGRQHLEVLDRRLVGNNEFRNTTNNFEGYRLRFGKKQNNWDLDTFVFQPVERYKYEFDQPDEDTWFYGAVLSIREWSDFITIQPYFLGRNTDGDPNNSVAANRKNDRSIYAPGLRVYGLFGESGFDFDGDINKQFGRFGETVNGTQQLRQHDALAYSLEVGYSFDHDWKPRASLYYGYGTGDKQSGDGYNQRFDAFYGFNQPWSRNDYYSWDNLHAPKARLEFTPYNNVRVDLGYNAYWLESETGGWNRANLRDRTGQSGSFMGHEFDIRLRHKLNPYIDWSMSYARFTPGDYTESFDRGNTAAGPFTSEPSNFFYFEVSLNAFGDGKPKYR